MDLHNFHRLRVIVGLAILRTVLVVCLGHLDQAMLSYRTMIQTVFLTS